MAFGDLSPKNCIEGSSDGTKIGNIKDKLKVATFGVDSASNDAFSRQRVSNPHILYSAVLNHNDKPLEFTEKLVGGTRVYTKAEAKVRLTGTTTINDRASRQTKEYFRYIAGQSALRMITTVFGTGSSGCAQRVGNFDDDNGFFFEQNGTNHYFTIRSKTTGTVVENAIEQASWNIDKFDGTGESGITLDFTKNMIVIFDFQYLGVGRVRMGFDIGGVIIYAHEFTHANITSGVYMSNPDLPMRWEVFNKTAPAAACWIDAICCSVIVEGDQSHADFARAAGRGISKVNITTTLKPICSVRLKSAYNRAQIIPKEYQVLLDGGKNFEIQVIVNGTLTGATWNSVGTNSITELDLASTAITGGEVIEIFYISKETRGTSDSQDTLMKILSDFDGVADTLTLAGRTTVGNEDVFGNIHFLEVY